MVLKKVFVGLNDLDDLIPFLDKPDPAVYTVENRKVLFFLFADDVFSEAGQALGINSSPIS